MSKQKITMYHNPSCSKSRETLGILEESKRTPEIIEYLNAPPDKTLLKDIISKLGLPARDLMRTTEPAYSEANLDINTMTEDDIINAICEHPSLLQRPIVVHGNKAIIGRPPTKVLDLI